MTGLPPGRAGLDGKATAAGWPASEDVLPRILRIHRGVVWCGAVGGRDVPALLATACASRSGRHVRTPTHHDGRRLAATACCS